MPLLKSKFLIHATFYQQIIIFPFLLSCLFVQFCQICCLKVAWTVMFLIRWQFWEHAIQKCIFQNFPILACFFSHVSHGAYYEMRWDWLLTYCGFVTGYIYFEQALVEKDWLAFGHPFADRVGMPAVSGVVNIPYELSRQSSAGAFPPSPMRQPSGSHASQNPSSPHAQTSNN